MDRPNSSRRSFLEPILLSARSWKSWAGFAAGIRGRCTQQEPAQTSGVTYAIQYNSSKASLMNSLMDDESMDFLRSSRLVVCFLRISLPMIRIPIAAESIREQPKTGLFMSSPKDLRPVQSRQHRECESEKAPESSLSSGISELNRWTDM